jgi:2-dehydro-3-deoxyphosphogluconate aldolase/(4S)-4-hydroxy-2-oxoglutarate aldolase
MNPLDLAGYGPVIPVIVIDRLEDAVPMAQALVAGGVRVLEVTLRTAAGLPAIAAIAREVPDAVVGAGTVRNAADARAAHAAGAKGIALLPGVSTGSEIMMAADDGFTFLKLFPATAVGGIPLLKAFSGPFSDIAFCPTGGVTPETASQFLALPNVKVVGGSWLTPADAMKSGAWARITALAKAASAITRD